MSALAAMSPEVLALLGLGTGLDAAGGLLGGQSDARAARKARDWTDRHTAAGAARLGRMVFGADFDPFYRDGFSIYDDPTNPASGAASSAFAGSYGGPVMQQMLDLERAVSTRQTGNLGYFDAETNRLDSADSGDLGSMMSYFNSTAGELGGFDDATERGVSRQYNELESALRQMGAGREKTIRSDAGDRLSSMNAQTQALAAASGFGNSTSTINAVNQNALNVGRETDRSLSDLNDSLMGNIAGARTGKAQAIERVRSGAAGRRAGVRGQQGAVMASAVAGRSSGRRTRAGQRVQLEDSNLGKDIALRSNRMELITSLLTSPTMNPWSSRSVPVAANNGAASALSGVGGSLAALGSVGAGQEMQRALLEQMLKQYGVG